MLMVRHAKPCIPHIIRIVLKIMGPSCLQNLIFRGTKMDPNFGTTHMFLIPTLNPKSYSSPVTASAGSLIRPPEEGLGCRALILMRSTCPKPPKTLPGVGSEYRNI